MGIGKKFKAAKKNPGSTAACGNLVCQKNDLVRAGYHLKLDEQRLVVMSVSKVDGRGFDDDGKEWHDGQAITITSKEWAEVFGISSKNAYTQLTRAARGLWQREITKIAGVARTDLRWIWQKSEIPVGAGQVTLYFSPGVLQYLRNLDGGFTKYRLRQIAGLHSTYSIRIFQLCMQFRTTGRAKVWLEELHEILRTPPSYRRRLSNFEQSVLAPAVNEIRTAAGLKDLDWEVTEGLVQFTFTPHSLPRLIPLGV